MYGVGERETTPEWVSKLKGRAQKRTEEENEKSRVCPGKKTWELVETLRWLKKERKKSPPAYTLCKRGGRKRQGCKRWIVDKESPG